MATPSFFLVYQDDEGHTDIIRHVDEKSAIQDVLKQYEQSKRVPECMIRGESRKVTIHTSVRFEEK